MLGFTQPSIELTDLMRSLKFQDATKEEQLEMLFQDAAGRLSRAIKKGNTEEIAKTFMENLSFAFQKMDMQLGITGLKDGVKEYTGLNALVDMVNEWVDDGDETKLTALEKTWEAIKGVGDAADSFAGTQGIATIGAITLLSEGAVAAATAAGGARAGQIVMAAIQGYFGYEGASLVIEGTGDIINAESKEEARGGGSKIGMGGVMLYGTYKSFKAGYDAYKQNKIKTMQEQQALIDGARQVFEIPEGTEITETVLKDAYRQASLKTHPDRMFAVLNNPEEVADIVTWNARGAGVWRATGDPLRSTIDANPEVFGAKPKAQVANNKTPEKAAKTTITKQSAPSQKLPEFVDKIYGAKAEAEAIVFGNVSLADIDPQIVQNATQELSNYFGREIKPSDLQVVKTQKGGFISYFDNETNLATTFSCSGKLNGQFKIKYDDQGNIQSYDLETIYSGGEFLRR